MTNLTNKKIQNAWKYKMQKRNEPLFFQMIKIILKGKSSAGIKYKRYKTQQMCCCTEWYIYEM